MILIFVPIGLVLAYFILRGLFALMVALGYGIGWVVVNSRAPVRREGERQEP